MFSRIALVACFTFLVLALSQSHGQPPAKEFTFVGGTWVGKTTVANTPVEIRTTFFKDGTCKSTAIVGTAVETKKGTWSYENDVLTTRSDTDTIRSVIKVIDANHTYNRGQGLEIDFYRQ